MTKQSKQIYLFLFLAILSYAVWKIFFYQEIIIKDQPFTKGYSVDNLELRITDEEGQLSAKFNSPSLIRYTDSEMVLIKQPQLLTYELGKENWNFRAETAEYNHKFDKVNLSEKVYAENRNENSKISFSSQDLMVDLKTKQAQTDNGISVNKEFSSMTGEKAKFDFKNDEIEVKNNVKVIYKSNQ